MGFDVSVKITTPISSEDIFEIYGRENKGMIKSPLNSETITSMAVRSTPVVVHEPVIKSESVPEIAPVAEPEPVVKSEPVPERAPIAEPEPVVKSESVPEIAPVAEPEPIVKSEPVPEIAPIAEPEPIYKPERKRVPATGTPLIKGQKVSITGTDRLIIGIGWDVSDESHELDTSLFMLAGDEKVPDESYFVFYGQESSGDGSVISRLNDSGFQYPDDAEFIIMLNEVDRNIKKLSVCISIYEAFRKGIDFSVVKNLYLRISDGQGRELFRYSVESPPNGITSMVIGEVYRYNNTWKFGAVGSGYKKELAGFCHMYGVEIE